MRTLKLIIVFALGSGALTRSRVLAQLLASPAAAPPASSRAADSLAARIDPIFARWNSPESPGCVVGVAREGTSIFERGYGMANLEHGVPLSAESILEIGSVSKQFVAAAIVLLAQRGMLSLDDDVRKYVPELPDFGKVITLRNLATHTSGLRDQWGLLGFAGRPSGQVVSTVPEVLDLLSRQRALNFVPNEEYLYSNSGYILLNVVVQRVAGQSLPEFTAAQIFRPLGMRHTQWRDDFARIVKGRAYAYSPATNLPGIPASFRLDMPFSNVFGSGGLMSTVGDLLLWNENYLTGKVGGGALAQQLQTRALLRDGRRINYALGLVVSRYRGVPEVSHGGSTAGYRAFLARYPGQRLSVAVLCNLASISAGDLAHRVADVFLTPPLGVAAVDSVRGSGATAARIALSSAEMAAWIGLYREASSDQTLRIAMRDGKLAAASGRWYDLTPVGLNRLRVVETPIELLRQPPRAGVASAIRWINGEDTTRYVAVDAVNPTRAQLGAYAGTYRSEELDVSYRVAMTDSSLVLRRPRMTDITLEPTYADAFRGGGMGFRFSRDLSGRVDGFAIFAGRVRNLRLDREVEKGEGKRQ